MEKRWQQPETTRTLIIIIIIMADLLLFKSPRPAFLRAQS